jgi:hypothetical protein
LVALALTVAVATGDARGECDLRREDEPCLWLDRGATLPALEAEAAPDNRWRAAAAVGGLYVGFSAWAYLAWYRNVESLDEFGWGGDGYFGRNTYAGGADKLGHAWATYTLGRATTGVLSLGGFGRTTAAVAGAGLSWALFLAVEVKDGFYYRFSPGDLVLNSGGAALAAGLSLVPALDRAIDFRVQYWPSDEYLGLWRGEYHGARKGNSLNIAEDYSGETYLLALHGAAVPRPRGVPTALATALDYLDVAIGFETRNYKPDAPATELPWQHVFVGVSVNLQRVLDRGLAGRRSRAARVTREVGTTILEYLAPPFSFVPVVGASRRAGKPAPEQ